MSHYDFEIKWFYYEFQIEWFHYDFEVKSGSIMILKQTESRRKLIRFNLRRKITP